MEQRLEQALDEIEEIEKIDEPITLLSKLIETHHLFDTPASDYEQFRNQIEEWIRTLLTIFLKKYISKVSELNSTIALQQEELESNRYELITLREENEQLNDLSLHLTEQINKLKYYLDEADSISKTLREEIVDLRSDNKSLIMALNDVEAQNMKLIDELHNLERNMNKDPSPKNSPEKNNYIEENKKLQEIISQQSALLETYSAQEKENAELREKCESLRIQNRKLELAISEKEKYEHMYLELKEKYDSLLTASLLSPKRLDSSRHTSSHKEDLRSASENLPRKPLSRITSPRNSAFGVIISPRENFKENKDPNILDLGSHHKMASIESPSDPSVVIHNDNQEEEAEEVLGQLYQKEAITEKLEELRVERSIENTKGKKMRFSDLFKPRFRKRTLLGCFLGLLQQLSGINCITYYSNQIFKQGLEDPDHSRVPQNFSFYMTIVNIIVVALSIGFVKNFGRKILNVLGLIIIIGCHLGFFLLGITTDDTSPISKYLIIVFVGAFSFSLGPALGAYLLEILPDLGYGLAILCNWVASIIGAQFFPMLVEAIGLDYTFLVLAILCIIGLIVVLVFMIETKGKSSKEVDELFYPNPSDEEERIINSCFREYNLYKLP